MADGRGRRRNRRRRRRRPNRRSRNRNRPRQQGGNRRRRILTYVPLLETIQLYGTPVIAVISVLAILLDMEGVIRLASLFLTGAAVLLNLAAAAVYGYLRDRNRALISLGAVLFLFLLVFPLLGGETDTGGTGSDRGTNAAVAAACDDLAQTIDAEYCSMYVETTGDDVNCGEFQETQDAQHQRTANQEACDWRYNTRLKIQVALQGQPIVEVNGQSFDCSREGFFDLHCPVT